MIEIITPHRDGNLSVPAGPERLRKGRSALLLLILPSMTTSQDQRRRTQVEAWNGVIVRTQTELKHSVGAARNRTRPG